MTPIQQLMLGVGASKKTYVDDVFSNYLYAGQSSTKTITNGIDNLGEGGMLWVKNRDNARGHQLYDTERLASGSTTTSDYSVTSDSDGAARDMSPNGIVTWKNDGWSVPGGDGDINQNGFGDYTSWNFRKAPGFFDVVTFNTGSPLSSNQRISHSLGCVPGFILIKNLDGSEDWAAYHRSTGGSGYWRFNQNNAFTTSGSVFFDPTATDFGFNSASWTGANTDFVAYVFAGGESTAATARSVDFDGNDYLSLASDSAFQFGTGDFTVEFWWKSSSTTPLNYHQTIGTQSVGGTDTGLWRIGTKTTSNKVYFSSGTGGGFDEPSWDANVNDMQWHHIAITRASGYIYCYVDGNKLVNSGGTNNITRSLTTSNSLFIGYNTRDNNYIYGVLSNVRIVKGTAVYTSSFRRPTEPLTNITNTTLLCCNNSSTTGSTVTPGTITANSNPTASTDSPFDDPAGFVFGDSKEGIIKCGSYIGNGVSGDGNGAKINLGWEPQWVMVKNADSNNQNWLMLDTMRAWTTTEIADAYMYANNNDAESTHQWGAPTSTGMQMDGTDATTNASGSEYVYIAIRRPDGYVGKPAEVGTDVFGIGTRSGSSSNALSNVNVFTDFSIIKRYNTSGEYWATNARLMGIYTLQTNSSDAQITGALPTSGGIWDHMAGHLVAASNGATNSGSDIIDYGWKRHAGFDVVTYKGNGNNTNGANAISHSLGKAPEMIWIKTRSGGTYSGVTHWTMSHKGLNGGTNPWQYTMSINLTNAEAATSNFGNTAPTSTHFYVGDPGNGRSNDNNSNYLAMLFASVDGISKVGSYTGTGSDLTITLGFQPRFVLIKDITASASWHLFDTVRGITSGNDKVLLLNSTDAETNTEDRIDLTSDGMTLHGMGSTNENNMNFIYYAHA